MATVDAFTLDSGKISTRQLLFIIITFIISTSDIFLPSVVAGLAGRDAWISVFVASAEALVIAAVAVSLSLRFPQKTLVQICLKVLGKWPGRLLALIILIGFFLNLAIFTVSQLGVILKVAFMPKTPLIIFNGTIVLIAAYAVYHGIETIGRLTELLMPLGIGMLILVGLMILPDVDFQNYRPFLEYGIGPVLSGSLRILSFLGEGVIIMMLMPYINKPQNVVRIIPLAILLLGFFLLVGVLAIGIFGASQTASLTFPALAMVRRIEIGNFLEHLDAIIMTVWISGIYIKLIVIYYICCIGFAQLANIKRYHTLIIPIGLIIATASVAWLNDIAGLVRLISYSWTGQALFYELMIPLVLLTAAVVRNLKESGQEGN